jgi:hypothetical protein
MHWMVAINRPRSRRSQWALARMESSQAFVTRACLPLPCSTTTSSTQPSRQGHCGPRAAAFRPTIRLFTQTVTRRLRCAVRTKPWAISPSKARWMDSLTRAVQGSSADVKAMSASVKDGHEVPVPAANQLTANMMRSSAALPYCSLCPINPGSHQREGVAYARIHNVGI